MRDESAMPDQAESDANNKEDVFAVDNDWGMESEDWSCDTQNSGSHVVVQQTDDVSKRCDESANECDSTQYGDNISHKSIAIENTDCDPTAELQQLNIDDIEEDEISSDDAIHHNIAESAGNQCEAEDVAMTPESDILRRLLKSEHKEDMTGDHQVNTEKLSPW